MSVRPNVKLWKIQFTNLFNGENNPFPKFSFIINFKTSVKHFKLSRAYLACLWKPSS